MATRLLVLRREQDGTKRTCRQVRRWALNLRKKIEPDPARPQFLAGVRGMGYRFDR